MPPLPGRNAPQPASPSATEASLGNCCASRRGLARCRLAYALAPRSASASVLPFLCDSTTRSSIEFAARHAAGDALSAPAAALAREVLRTMLLSKIKLTAISLFLVTSVATGAGRAALAGDEGRTHAERRRHLQPRSRRLVPDRHRRPNRPTPQRQAGCSLPARCSTPTASR